MKSQIRLVPHLNSLYEQKKSYQIHYDKIQTIKRSISSSKKSLYLKQAYQNQQDNISNSSFIKPLISHKQVKSDISLEKMSTIQQVKDISYWMKKMNPYQKRLKQQQLKQNKRLRQKIKNSVSFVNNRNQIQQHDYKFSSIKSRLLRYHNVSDSHIKSLKCQTVLRKITQIQRQKMKTQQSRIKILKNLSLSQKINANSNDTFLSKQLLPKISINKQQYNNRYLNNNKTQLLKHKKRSLQIDYSSKSSLLNIKQDFKMPFLKQRNIKTQIQQIQTQNKIQKYKPIVNRVIVNQSKLSKLSTKSYLSEQKQPRSLNNIKIMNPSKISTKLKFVTSYDYQKNKSMNSQNRKLLSIIKTQQNSQRTLSAVQKKLSNFKEQKALASHNSLMKKIDFQRKKIQKYYTYKNTYQFNHNSHNKITPDLNQKANFNSSQIPIQYPIKTQYQKITQIHQNQTTQTNNSFPTEILS